MNTLHLNRQFLKYRVMFWEGVGLIVLLSLPFIVVGVMR